MGDKNMGLNTKHIEQLYLKNNNKCVVKNGHIILDNMFIIHIHKTKDKMSNDDVVSAFTKMEKLKLDFKCNQYIIISENGYTEDIKDFTEFNIRLEDINYLNELEAYSGSNYNELLCHNKAAVNFVESKFENDKNLACVIQPTGSGKSYIIKHVLYNLKIKFKRKLVIAPNVYIIDQIKNACINNIDGDEINFITYSLLSFMTKSEMLEIEPDIIVLDEFHRAGASEWKKGISKLLSMYKNAKILGTTATEIRYLDKKRDMSEELFEGHSYNRLSLLSAMSRRILPIPKYIVAQYTINSDIDEILNNLDKKNLPDDIAKHVYADIEKFKFSYDTENYMINILKKYITEDMSKFIVFCKNLEHLEKMRGLFKDWFTEAMPNKNINIYSVMSSNSNSSIEFEEFKECTDFNSINLLFSINQITEGIHIKVSGVFLCRPTISPILYYQQIGRTMSTNFDGNPLIFDLVNNNESINNNRFREDLEVEFKNHNKKYKHTVGGKVRDLDYLKEINALMIDETKDFRELLERNKTYLHGTWMNMFLTLKDYYDEYKTFSLKANEEIPEKYHGLKSFVARMRKYYTINRLEQDKVDKLNSINFTWDMRDDAWQSQYEKVLHYAIESNNDGNIIYKKSWSIPTTTDIKLNRWVEKQRSLYRKGSISDRRIKMLNDINMTWDHNRTDDRGKLEILKDYKEKYGNLDIIRSDEEHVSLSLWMSKFRNKRSKGLISDEDLAFANEIGFVWSLREERWNKNFQKFKEYCNNNNVVDNYGLSKVPGSIKSWIYRTKRDYEKGILDEGSIEKIKENNFEIFFNM